MTYNGSSPRRPAKFVIIILMKSIIPTIENTISSAPTAQVVNIQEEQKLQKEAEALVELHDFIKAHPDSPVKEIARFMPPVDARVVNMAIQVLAIRDQNISDKEKEVKKKEADAIEVGARVGKWGNK